MREFEVSAPNHKGMLAQLAEDQLRSIRRIFLDLLKAYEIANGTVQKQTRHRQPIDAASHL